MNIFKYVKNNPKKSVFGTLVCGYVGNWINGLHNDHVLRHAMCHKLLHHGTEPVHWFFEPKTITIFLNPAANGGKASKLFEKNAAPILNLSGCKVNVVKLDYEGQAKQLMSVLEKSDVIVAAGGNGTLSEVVTGLLRRPDFKAWANVPIGVIPLGETNTLCRQLCTNCDPDNYAQWIMTATSNILKTSSRPVDVMKITGDNDKTVYALSDIRWGSYSDAYGKKSKYWYWGPLKKYMTFVFASVRHNIQTARELEIDYDDPMPIPLSVETTEAKVNFQSTIAESLALRFINLFAWIWKSPMLKSQDEETSDEKSSQVPEAEEKVFSQSKYVKTLEFTASLNTHDPQAARQVASAHISLEKGDFSKIGFIQGGPQRFLHGPLQNVDLLTEMDVGRFRLLPADPDGTWFKIDNEDYEAMSCEVELLPNRIRMICSEDVKYSNVEKT